MKSEGLMKEHEVRRRDLLILKYDKQRSLCDEIILRQQKLIEGETRAESIMRVITLILIAMDDNKSTGYTQGKILLLRFTIVDFFLEILECFASVEIVVISDVVKYLPRLIYFCVQGAVFPCPLSYWSSTSSTSRRWPAGMRRRPTI